MDLNGSKRSFDQLSEDEPEKIKKLFFNTRGTDGSFQVVAKTVDLSQSLFLNRDAEYISRNANDSSSNIELTEEYLRMQKEILSSKYDYAGYAEDLKDSYQSNPFGVFWNRRSGVLLHFADEQAEIIHRVRQNQPLIPYQSAGPLDLSAKRVCDSTNKDLSQIDFDLQNFKQEISKGQTLDESQRVLEPDTFQEKENYAERSESQGFNALKSFSGYEDEKDNLIKRNYIFGEQLEQIAEPLSTKRVQMTHEFNKVQEIVFEAEYEFLNFKVKHFKKSALENAHQICLERLNLESQNNDICYHVYCNLGMICLLELDSKEASANFQNAMKLKPDAEEPFYLIGIICAIGNYFELAIEFFKKAIEKNKKFFKAYYAMGLAHLRKGEPRETIRICHAVLEAHSNLNDEIPDQEDDNLLKDYHLIKKLETITYFDHGFQDLAFQNFQHLVDEETSIQPNSMAIVEEDFEDEDQGEIRDVLGQMTEMLGDDLLSKLQLSITKTSSASWSRRLNDFIQEIQDKDYADICYRMGKILYNDLDLILIPEKLEQAIKYLKEAVKGNNKNPKYFVTYGQVLEMLTRFDEAIKQYEEATVLDLHEIDAHFFWGRTLFKKAQYKDAILKIQQVENKKKDFVEIHIILGLCYLRLEDFGKALEMLQKAFKFGLESAKIFSSYTNFAFHSCKNPQALMESFLKDIDSKNLWNESQEVYWSIFFSSEQIIEGLCLNDFLRLLPQVLSNPSGFLKLLNIMSERFEYEEEFYIFKSNNKHPVYLTQFDMRRNVGAQRMIIDFIFKPSMPTLAIKELKKIQNIYQKSFEECSNQRNSWIVEGNFVQITFEICLQFVRQGDLTEGKKYLLLISQPAFHNDIKVWWEWKTFFIEGLLAFCSQNSFTEAINWFKKSLKSKQTEGIRKFPKINGLPLFGGRLQFESQDSADLSEIHLWLGQSYYLNKKFIKAIHHLSQAAQYNPHCSRAHSLMSISYLSEGKSNDAFSEWRKAFDINFEDWIAYSNWPERLITINEQNIKEKIIESYQKAIKIWVGRNKEFLFLAGISIKLQRFNEAITLCQSILETDSTSTQALLVQGIAFLNQGNLQEALESWEKSIKIDRKDWISYFYQGKALFDYERYQEAEEKFEKCLQIKYDCSEACVFLCIIHFMKGDFERGISEYEGVYANFCKDWTWRYNYSKILLEKSIGKIALESKQKSSPPCDQNDSSTKQLLEDYINNSSEAINDDEIYNSCQEIRMKEPNNWLAILALAVSLLKRNQFQEAMVRLGEIFETKQDAMKLFKFKFE